MYKSPIETTYENMQTQLEDAVLKMVRKVGINVNKDELIKALKYDRDQYNQGYFDGWYEKSKSIVRCKDCKYYNFQHHYCDGIGNWFGFENEWSDNGFCYKGERKENE